LSQSVLIACQDIGERHGIDPLRQVLLAARVTTRLFSAQFMTRRQRIPLTPDADAFDDCSLSYQRALLRAAIADAQPPAPLTRAEHTALRLIDRGGAELRTDADGNRFVWVLALPGPVPEAGISVDTLTSLTDRGLTNRNTRRSLARGQRIGLTVAGRKALAAHQPTGPASAPRPAAPAAPPLPRTATTARTR
jgi:hypothetical protein